MKQCTEQGDDKTKFYTTAINTYGTYDNMRDSHIHKHLPNLKAIWRKLIILLDTFKVIKIKDNPKDVTNAYNHEVCNFSINIIKIVEFLISRTTSVFFFVYLFL